MAAFAGFKQAYKDAALEGYGKIWAGPVKYNAERAKPYTHGWLIFAGLRGDERREKLF